MAHIYNPSYTEGRNGRIAVQGQPRQKKLARSYLKKKKKIQE
jgi:hypothetical protein